MPRQSLQAPCHTHKKQCFTRVRVVFRNKKTTRRALGVCGAYDGLRCIEVCTKLCRGFRDEFESLVSWR